jgi:hypothetical protein
MREARPSFGPKLGAKLRAISEQFRGLAVGAADMKAKPVRSQEATLQQSSQVLDGGNEKRPLI